MASSGNPLANGKHEAAGPFGIGNNPRVVQGESNGTGNVVGAVGNPQVLGPQNFQHGSGAEVRTAPVGWPPLRPEAAAVDWGGIREGEAGSKW